MGHIARSLRMAVTTADVAQVHRLLAGSSSEMAVVVKE